ncbi:hypothetical protein BK658_01945 [Pseudomonas brassicacearum]|uniref:Uncharacterized protein n=1 Tax=Pseudomonas brassicacearum TaxID=930166 RepID=A0A423H1A7_9PSED|nr:hypothetical protein BK658_01945 [Pseudomonas brassicacearum]
MPPNGMRKQRWRSPWAADSARLEQTAQARHAQGINQHAIAHCILAKQAFCVETKLAIQPDRRFVIRSKAR